MKSLKKLISRLLVMIFCLLVTRVSIAGGPPPTAQQCEDALEVTVIDMDFGSFIGGTTGTIIMDATGAMVPTGGIVLVGGAVGIPATYNLVAPGKNCNKRDVTFVMPSSITINNVSGSPATTLIISNLVTDLPTNPFQVRNVPTIKIGGTLTVTSTGSAQAPYTGLFDVSFTFQ